MPALMINAAGIWSTVTAIQATPQSSTVPSRSVGTRDISVSGSFAFLDGMYRMGILDG